MFQVLLWLFNSFLLEFLNEMLTNVKPVEWYRPQSIISWVGNYKIGAVSSVKKTQYQLFDPVCDSLSGKKNTDLSVVILFLVRLYESTG